MKIEEEIIGIEEAAERVVAEGKKEAAAISGTLKEERGKIAREMDRIFDGERKKLKEHHDERLKGELKAIAAHENDKKTRLAVRKEEIADKVVQKIVASFLKTVGFQE